MKRNRSAILISLALLAGLICLSGFAPLTAQDNLVTREYDIMDLVMPVVATPAAMNYHWISVRTEGQDNYLISPPFPGDELVSVIQLLDKNQATGAKIGFRSAAGKLIITQTAEMHKNIQGFLAYLRGIINPQVGIEARLIVIDNAVLSELRELMANSAILSEPALQLLAEKGLAYKTARKSGYSGNIISFSDTKLTAYQKDYDIVIVNAASSTALGEIVISTIDQGLRFNIRPSITPDKNIRLDIQLRDAALVAIDQVNPALSGECQSNIELPTLDETDINTSLTVPANQTVLAGLLSLKETGKNLAILLTPSVSAEPAPADGFTIPGTNKIIKLFDLNSLVTLYQEHYLAGIPSVTPGGAPVIGYHMPTELPPVYYIDPNEIQSILVNQTGLNLDGDIYAEPDNGYCQRLSDSNSFLIIQTADGIRKITEYIKTLAAPPALITVSAQLITVEDGLWKTLVKDKKADLSKGALDPKALKDLRAEDGKGRVKILTTNQVTGSAGQSVLALNYRISEYIQDIDIQAGAYAYEPVINSVASGSGLNVKSIAQGNIINIVMDWRFIDLKLQPLATTQGKFLCHKPQLDLKLFNGNIRVTDGIWTIAQSTASRDLNGVIQNQILIVKASVTR